MKFNEHTPGPWKADIRTGCFAVYPAHEDHVCLSGVSREAIVYQNGRGEESSPGSYLYLSSEQEANARLIAAAPELLAALESLLAYEDDVPPEGSFGAEIYAKAKAAIRKAKGE